MPLTQISVNLILGILDGARRVVGDEAIRMANSVDGLKVTPHGEIAVSGDGMEIVKKLLKVYEEELHGEIVLDLDVRMNVKSSGK